jgi:hypothetical protein
MKYQNDNKWQTEIKSKKRIREAFTNLKTKINEFKAGGGEDIETGSELRNRN